MNLDKFESKSRTRIQKLCDYCRLKKIKCDGQKLCQNCKNGKIECTYNHIPKKRSKKIKTEPVVKNVKKANIEDRVSKVEQIMYKILDIVSKKEESDDDEEDDDESIPSTPLTTPMEKQYIPKSEESSVVVQVDKSEHYFGSHSSFSIFSPRGIKWIASKSQNIPIMKYYQKLHLDLGVQSMKEHKKWIEPVDSSQVGNLPSLEIYSFFLRAIFATPLYSQVDLVLEELIELYKKPEKSNSESMMLNVLCCLGVFLLYDLYQLYPEFQQTAKDLQIDTELLTKIENDCFQNCIFYYHRLCIIGDGISTISALLLLITYCEMSFNAHACYMMVSTVIRSAQELGLHRYESYIGMDPQQAYKRLVLFWQCYITDKATSLKSGKPPVLNDDDISSIDTEKLKEYWYNNMVEMKTLKFDVSVYLSTITQISKPVNEIEQKVRRLALKQKMAELIRVEPSNNTKNYVKFYYLELLEITSKAYKLLFSARLLIGKTAVEVEDMVSELNKDLRNWFESIPDELKLESQDVSQVSVLDWFTGNTRGMVFCQSMFIQLQYYYVTMTINRVSSRTSWIPTGDLERKKKAATSIDLCLESARVIVKLTGRIDTKISQFFKSCSFFPFCAVITLFSSCLQDILLSHAKDDIKLMIEVSQMFAQWGVHNINKKLRHLDQLIRFMCIIVIDVFEKNYPQDKTFQIPEYKVFFQQTNEQMQDFIMSKKKKHKKPSSSSEPVAKKKKQLQPSPKQVSQQQQQVLSMPMFNTDSISTNDVSPASSSNTTTLFNDLLDDPLFFDNVNQANNATNNNNFYLYQNLFNLPTFMLDGTSPAGSNDNPNNSNNLGLFEF